MEEQVAPWPLTLCMGTPPRPSPAPLHCWSHTVSCCGLESYCVLLSSEPQGICLMWDLMLAGLSSCLVSRLLWAVGLPELWELETEPQTQHRLALQASCLFLAQPVDGLALPTIVEARFEAVCSCLCPSQK